MGNGSRLSVRVGNVPSPVEGWSEWVPLDGGVGKIPSGRFAQWKAELDPGTTIDQVALNYLPRNVAPVVDDIAVQLGAHIAPGTATPASTTVQVNFPAPSTAAGLTLPPSDPGTGPLTGQKDRASATVRWAAHDDNGDDLMFAVWYRGGIGEKELSAAQGQDLRQVLQLRAGRSTGWSLRPQGRGERWAIALGRRDTDGRTDE